MDQFKLEKVQPYYEQIYQSLKELIFEGDYQPGYRINEVKIAKEFNVSRSPVREAIRALVKEGLLVSNEKSQLEVYKPSFEDVEEVYQCRAALESLAVELATIHPKKEAIMKMEKLLETTKRTMNGSGNKQEIIHLNVEFHDHIQSLCQNSRLQKLLDDLRSLTQFYRGMNIEGKGREQIIFNEHYDIFLHMKSGDEKGASTLMTEHITHDLQHLKMLLEEKKFN